MNRLLNILTLALLVVVLTACHDHNKPETVDVADKTVFIYMPFTGGGSPDLYGCFKENIDSIVFSMNKHTVGHNNVIAFISRNSRIAHLINYHEGKTSQGMRIVADTLQTFNSLELNTKESITEILTNVKHFAPANKYAMIVGAHGEGWVPGESSRANKTRWYGGSLYQTNLSTLVDAIKDCDLHMQFMLFDCCYMACIENVYEVREVTDYYISSTSEVMDVGMPYKYIFHSLLLNEPDYADVVKEYHKFYTNYPMPYGTISISDCSYAEPMANLMKDINQSERFEETATRTDVLSQLQDLDAAHFEPTVYFDFGSYVDHCCTDQNLLDRYHDLIKKLVPYKAATKMIFSLAGNKTESVKEFSGLTISDPSINSSIIDSKLNTPWWKATHY